MRYTHDEAWMLVDGAWRETEPVFVRIKAKRLTKQAYLDAFGRVPPLPSHAFLSDPSRWPIRFGCDDGVLACYADCKWRKISPTELVSNVAVLSEANYMRSFGPTGRRPVPPLPDAAFRSGWSSPLV